MRLLVIVTVCLVFLSCNKKERKHNYSKAVISQTEIKYAKGFKIDYVGNSKLVEVTYPFQGATSGYKYLLVPRDEKVPEHDAETKVISIPLNTIVCTSTTHIPFLNYLNETDKLIGFPSTDYISSEKMRRRIDEGHVQDLGIDNSINIEMLVTLKPDMVMGYTVSSDYGQFKKIDALGIPVVINAEYLEEHPLGRAEWIKFMALFFNKERMADSVFKSIEHNYLQTKSMVAKVSTKPNTVLCGIVYGDAWFLPGGQNYGSKLLKDAGYKYLWEADSSKGFLQLSFESVYERAHDADLWFGVGTFNTLIEIKNADHRYQRFKPFIEKKVYNYNARKGAKGGSEFMELGYLRPDIILKDLVKIAHPEILPGYELYFYKKLQ